MNIMGRSYMLIKVLVGAKGLKEDSFVSRLEAMQCPDVVVASFDTNSFQSKQTVHVNEVHVLFCSNN